MVLDASLAVGCLFEDEVTAARLEALDRIGDHGAWVPSLWHLEVANSLQIGVKRGRYSEAFADQSLARLAGLPISVDPETMSRAWHAILQLARIEGLTVYDASYLELALRRRLPIATCDLALARASQRNGLEVVGL